MITIASFIKLLQNYAIKCNFSSDTSLVTDDFDRVNSALPVTKQTAARLCHGVLLYWLKEPDNDDWSAARLLKDIYDCHTCVIHVAQVYVKGIIPSDSTEPPVFGNKTELSEEAADAIVQRLFNLQPRLEVQKLPVPEIRYIGEEDVGKLKSPLVVDVRPLVMSESGNNSVQQKRTAPDWVIGLGKQVTFKNHPLKEIIQNPYILGTDLMTDIVLFCSKGYQSTLAADVLVKAGYRNIFVFKTVYSN